MKIKKNTVMYYVKAPGYIDVVTVQGKKKGLFSKIEYITFKNTDKKIPWSEINKSLFFTLKGAEQAC